jgi:hypothetical protein
MNTFQQTPTLAAQRASIHASPEGRERTMKPGTSFRTIDLLFAAFLHSTRALPFLGCEVNGRGRIAFVFDDPNAQGGQLHIEFESEAQCPAAAFYDSVKHLRRIMDRSKLQTNRGTFEHDYREQYEYHPQPFR